MLEEDTMELIVWFNRAALQNCHQNVSVQAQYLLACPFSDNENMNEILLVHQKDHFALGRIGFYRTANRIGPEITFTVSKKVFLFFGLFFKGVKTTRLKMSVKILNATW